MFAFREHLTESQILRATRMREKGWAIRDIAAQLDVPRDAIAALVKNLGYRLGHSRPSVPKRCPDCGHLVSVVPCIECQMEQLKQQKLAARRLAAETMISVS